MNGRRLLALAVACLVMAGVALLLWQQQESDTGVKGQLFLPELAAALAGIDKVTIVAPGGETVATIERGSGDWTVREAADYPADLARLRRNLTALSEARVVEIKTSRPEFYERLGVQDIEAADAGGLMITIEGPDYSTGVIIGDTNVAGGNQAYVRKAGEAQSYLIGAKLETGTELTDWLDSQLLDIAPDEIKRVRIEHPDGESLTIVKDSPEFTDFEVLDIPEGRELAYAGVANSIGAALSGLDFDAVMAAEDFAAPASPPVLTRFETFDGLTIESRSWRSDDGWRVAFSASASEGPPLEAPDQESEGGDRENDPGARADKLNDRLDGWIYTLPSYKTDQLIKRMSDLLAADD